MTVYFWIIKVLTTGMGETASDWLAHLFGPITAVGLGGMALVGALVVQFAVRRYVAWIYWTAIVMVSVFGTMAADVLHVGLGVPYALSTPFFMAALAAVFALWYRSEGTLSIHSITRSGPRTSSPARSVPPSPTGWPSATTGADSAWAWGRSHCPGRWPFSASSVIWPPRQDMAAT